MLIVKVLYYFLIFKFMFFVYITSNWEMYNSTNTPKITAKLQQNYSKNKSKGNKNTQYSKSKKT